MTDHINTYDNAPEALVSRWQARRAPLHFDPGEGLPPLDADLCKLAAKVLSGAPATGGSSFAKKRAALAVELAGQSELALLHALVIACLRKRSWPGDAPALFRRIWAEQGNQLITVLPARWLIAAAITFADHGQNEAQRRLGQSLNMLFSLMKLYEFERLYSGLAPSEPFPRTKRSTAALPLGMEPFSLVTGGLDVNLLAPVWAEAQADPVLGPLACHLLEQLNADPGTMFRRLDTLRDHAAARRQRAERRS